MSETVPSLIAAPTVLPAGTVIELSVFCPGSSFIGVFFNNGIDVDGDGILEFSKLTQPVLQVDHYKCYEADGDDVQVTVNLFDQFDDFFGPELDVEVGEPELFCNPVQKDKDGEIGNIIHPMEHLTCYEIEDDEEELDVVVVNQFGTQNLVVDDPKLLCVPSAKISVTPHEQGDDGDDDD